jgi:hypothetical protein
VQVRGKWQACSLAAPVFLNALPNLEENTCVAGRPSVLGDAIPSIGRRSFSSLLLGFSGALVLWTLGPIACLESMGGLALMIKKSCPFLKKDSFFDG